MEPRERLCLAPREILTSRGAGYRLAQVLVSAARLSKAQRVAIVSCWPLPDRRRLSSPDAPQKLGTSPHHGQPCFPRRREGPPPGWARAPWGRFRSHREWKKAQGAASLRSAKDETPADQRSFQGVTTISELQLCRPRRQTLWPPRRWRPIRSRGLCCTALGRSSPL